MNQSLHLVLDLLVIGILIGGIHRFRAPATARQGNRLAAAALALGAALTLWRNGLVHPGALAAAVIIGGGIGRRLAVRVTMVQIPAMVAFQHGAGGLAASLVAYVELVAVSHGAAAVHQVSGLAGVLIGAATFSGSLVASAKLSGRMRATPIIVPGHGLAAVVLTIAAVGIGLLALGPAATSNTASLLLAAILAVGLGLLLAVRIGGADMPVLISFLNATAGLAAAACGIILQDHLLIAFGATVAASGSILTHVMCRAMNRRLATVFVGQQGEANFRPFEIFHRSEAATLHKEAPVSTPAREARAVQDPLAQAAAALAQAQRVVIIPGYGMALAQAQFNTARLAAQLTARGKSVRFAIHPVAGRMPGHMHVLLAEADVDYEMLWEMEAINDDFRQTDVALVVGACDVVNPAAISVEGTPLSGMPILMAHQARTVVVCNLDRNPGYSGVENPLYDEPGTILLLGDARQSTADLLEKTAES